MRKRIEERENDLAITFSEAEIEALGLKPGDEVFVEMWRAEMPESSREDRLKLLEGLRKYRGAMPADFKFNRDEANEGGNQHTIKTSAGKAGDRP